MFELAGGSEPVYRQLAKSIKGAIRDGLYRAGDQLPTVRAVASSLLLNPNTVARAYQQLEKDGIIETIVGRGSFVLGEPEGSRRLQSLIADGIKQLWEAGWTSAELEAWCLSVVRALQAGKD